MKARREVETPEFLGFARRIIRRAGERVADGDPIDLADLVSLRRELEAIEVQAVASMRERYGYSWSEIASDLGITRQAAQQYYGRRMSA